MNKRFALCLCLVLGLTCLKAGDVCTETTYFAPEYKAGPKPPLPEASWKIYARKRIFRYSGGHGVEHLDGPEKGTTIWKVGDLIAVAVPGRRIDLFSRKAGDETLWDDEAVSYSWIKGLAPLKTEKIDGREIQIFDSGNGYRRAWLPTGASLPLAAVNGRFVTLFAKDETDREITVPAEVLEAIKERQRGEKKAEQMGAMPAAE